MHVDVLDFRSDTITRPTDDMRDAMRSADVGDDVLGDDPTVNRLQEEAAAKLGMEAGLFVPSGTMANQIALWVHTARHGQAIVEENSHVALYEGGAAALLSGTTLRTVRGERGFFGSDHVRPHLFPDDPHFAPTKVVCVENTHNWAGGTIWDPDALASLSGFVHTHGAAMHMDGARLWHAAVERGAPPSAWTSTMDSAMFCLSKGLSAPVGSVLCGSTEFIHESRRIRKALGGGMRQAGIIAAAGLVALESMVDRLAEDHANAKALAQGLSGIEALRILEEPETNIAYVDVSGTELSAPDFIALMEDVGVRCLNRDSGPVVRFVTHRHIERAHVDDAVNRVASLFEV